MFIVAIVVGMFVAAPFIPPRSHYPHYDLTPEARQRCNAAADAAYLAAQRKPFGFDTMRLEEVDAFEACAKAATK